MFLVFSQNTPINIGSLSATEQAQIIQNCQTQCKGDASCGAKCLNCKCVFNQISAQSNW